MRVIIATYAQSHLRYPSVILASKLSLIIFIGLCGPVELLLKSVRVHFAPGKITITLELLGQFLRLLDQNDRHSLGVLLIY